MTEPPAPADCASQEQRLLVGEHLEQYRHPTRNPADWWLAALQEDAGDSRANCWLGRQALDQGRLADAEMYLQRAVDRLTERHPNPVDGEPVYLLGLCHERQGQLDQAIGRYRKAAWNYAWRTPGLYRAALLHCRLGQPQAALALCRDAQRTNIDCGQAQALEARLLRHAGNHGQAVIIAQQACDHDAMDFLARAELWFAGNDQAGQQLQQQLHHDAELVFDLVSDAAAAGHWEEALRLLALAPITERHCFWAAWLCQQRGDAASAIVWLRRIDEAPIDELFPQGWMTECILQNALTLEPQLARAAALMGTLCYAIPQRRDEAIHYWQQALNAGSQDPVIARNLGLARANHQHDLNGAQQAYEQAQQLAPTDARLLYEMDQLRKKSKVSAHNNVSTNYPPNWYISVMIYVLNTFDYVCLRTDSKRPFSC